VKTLLVSFFHFFCLNVSCPSSFRISDIGVTKAKNTIESRIRDDTRLRIYEKFHQNSAGPLKRIGTFMLATSTAAPIPAQSVFLEAMQTTSETSTIASPVSRDWDCVIDLKGIMAVPLYKIHFMRMLSDGIQHGFRLVVRIMAQKEPILRHK
jgi:hypothetical protein